MTSAPRTNDPEPESGESLEEMTQQTAETMADAREKVDRARGTLHDQILPDLQGGEEGDYEDGEAGPDKDDTRGGWPKWT